MKHLIIDGLLNGTGIRDGDRGGYIIPEDLNLSPNLICWLNSWLKRYENEFYSGYKVETLIEDLDAEGKKIALLVKNELQGIQDLRIEYYSDAKLIKYEID